LQRPQNEFAPIVWNLHRWNRKLKLLVSMLGEISQRSGINQDF